MIYLFFHLPKTGGAALFENVQRFLPKTQCLRLNCSHRQYYFDPKTGALSFYESEEDFACLLASLSEKEKAKIAFASGHDLAYGLHSRFPQKARYFTFVREPIARTLSLYNYQKTQHEFLQSMQHKDESHRRLALFSEKWFLREGKVPSFERWLEESYDGAYPFYSTMTRSLQSLGYLEGPLQEKSFERCLAKFFFVGLTETLNEDAFYLYAEMGVRRFWAPSNASKKHISWESLDKQTQEKVREKNQSDFLLYECAKKANASFKETTPAFFQKAKKARWQKKKMFFLERLWPACKSGVRPFIKPLLRLSRLCTFL